MTDDAVAMTPTPTPKRVEALDAWETLLDVWPRVLADLDLANRTRKAWSIGRWMTITSDNRAIFGVPNAWVQRACLETLKDVQAHLWLQWAGAREPVIDVIVEVAPDDADLEGRTETLIERLGDSFEEFVKVALGEAIQAARKKLGLSQRELGKRIGMDQSAISIWERGAGPGAPNVDRVLRLDLALGLQPGTLLVRAGLVRPDAIEAAVRRTQDQAPSNVSRVTVTTKTSIRTMNFSPRLTVERWLELVRTMIGSEEKASEVTQVEVTAADQWGGVESSFEMPEGGLDLEEVLRIVELMLESQRENTPPASGRVDRDELRRLLARVKNPDDARVLVEREGIGLTFDEIAKAEGITVEEARGRAKRAMDQARAYEPDEEPPF